MELNANHVEAILFGAARPVKLSEMKSLLSNQGIKVELSEIKEVLNDLELRLIGPLQTNKVKDSLKLFDVIETVDRERLAIEIAKYKDIKSKTFGKFTKS